MRWTRTRTVLLAASAAIAIACGAAWLVFRTDPSAAFHAHLAALEAKGVPTSWEQVVADAPPEEENGADELLAAVAWLERHHPEPWDVTGQWDPAAMQPWWEHAEPEQLAALEDFLEEIRPFYEQVDTALAAPTISFAAPPAPGEWFPPHDWVADARKVANCLEAASRAARTPADRLVSVERQLRLARRLEYPTLLACLVRLAIESQALSSLQQALEQFPVDVAAGTDRLLPHLGADELSSPLPYLRCARTETLAAGRAIEAGLLPTANALQRVSQWLKGDAPPTLGDVVRASEAFGRLHDAPDVRSYRELKALAELESGRAIHVEWAFLVIAGTERIQKTLAARALARLALVSARERASTGRWPDSLDELRPHFPGGLPLDPYTDAPFRVERLPDGIRLSAGYELEPREDSLRELGLEWTLTDPE